MSPPNNGFLSGCHPWACNACYKCKPRRYRTCCWIVWSDTLPCDLSVETSTVAHHGIAVPISKPLAGHRISCQESSQPASFPFCANLLSSHGCYGYHHQIAIFHSSIHLCYQYSSSCSNPKLLLLSFSGKRPPYTAKGYANCIPSGSRLKLKDLGGTSRIWTEPRHRKRAFDALQWSHSHDWIPLWCKWCGTCKPVALTLVRWRKYLSQINGTLKICQVMYVFNFILHMLM